MRYARLTVVAGLLLAGSASAQLPPTLASVIDVGGAPFDGIAATPDGAKVYVTTRLAGPDRFVVAVIDTSTDSVVATIDLGPEGAGSSSARQIVMSPDGSRAYAMTPLDNIIAIDVASDAVAGSVNFGNGFDSRDLEISRDGSKLYVANFAQNEVTIIDAANLVVTGGVPVESVINGLAQSPLGDRLYALTTNDGGTSSLTDPVIVTAIDTSNDSVLYTVGVGTGILANAGVTGRTSPDGDILYVGAASMSVVVAVDAATGAEIDDVPVAQYSESIDLTRDGAFLWNFTNGFQAGEANIIDTSSFQIVADVDTTGQVLRFDNKQTIFTPDGEFAILPAYNGGVIFTADVGAMQILSTIDVDGTPTAGLYVAGCCKTYVTSRTGAYTGNVVVIDVAPGIWNHCQTSTNSVGPGALISSTGSPSISAGDLTLIATGGPPNKFGLFYYGPNELQIPFGNGFRCVGSGGLGLFRLNPPQMIDGTGGASRALDYDQPPMDAGLGAIAPGTTWSFQFWYRDPAAGGANFNLSNGLRVSFCP